MAVAGSKVLFLVKLEELVVALVTADVPSHPASDTSASFFCDCAQIAPHSHLRLCGNIRSFCKARIPTCAAISAPF